MAIQREDERLISQSQSDRATAFRLSPQMMLIKTCPGIDVTATTQKISVCMVYVCETSQVPP